VTTGRAADELAGIARRTTDAELLRRRLSEPLQRLVGAGPVFVASADPATWLMTGASSLDVPADATPLFLRNEYAAADVVKFRQLAAAARPYGALSWATGGDLTASARWRDVLEPLGWGDELRVALRDGRRTWGFLCLHRAAGEPAFTPADVALLAPLLPALGAAFRRTAAPATGGEPAGPPTPGVVVVDQALRRVSATPAAERALALLGGAADGDLPLTVRAVAAHALTGSSPPAVSVRGRDGRWLSLHADTLDDAGRRVAVVIEAARPADALPALAAAIGLTPREVDVVAATLRGGSTRQISAELRIAEHTVQDHLKAIFAKSGARSRGELTAFVLGSR
jgi:DNA-binding CsgD family transcriptional regulator